MKNMWQTRPTIGVLFGEDKLSLELDFEGTDCGVKRVLVGFGVNVLIFVDLEGDQMRRYHVTNDFQFRQFSTDFFGD